MAKTKPDHSRVRSGSEADNAWRRASAPNLSKWPLLRKVREAVQADFLEMFAVIGERLQKEIARLGTSYGNAQSELNRHGEWLARLETRSHMPADLRPQIRDLIAVALQPYVRTGFLPEAKAIESLLPMPYAERLAHQITTSPYLEKAYTTAENKIREEGFRAGVQSAHERIKKFLET